LKEKARMPIMCAIVAVLLVSTFVVFSPVSMLAAQEIPREDVYIHSSDWGPPPGWNALQGRTDSCCHMTEIMYPTLYLYTMYTDEWIPYAAESYQWIDKYTLQVKIRDEAKWWDGKPVTAEDVKYSLELGKTYVVAMYTPLWDYIESVEAVDEKTVQFITSDEKLNYFQMFNVLQNPLILPKHRWEGLVAEYGDKLPTEFRDDEPDKIVGAGPYKLMSWTEEVFYYERVDDWWGKDIFGVPTIKYVAHKDFKDNMAAALAFEAGELDVMTHFTPKIWEIWEVKGLARRTYYGNAPYYPHHNIVFLYMNFAKPPLDDTTVRRAVAYVLPIDDMISKAYFNYSIRAASVPIIHDSPAATYINQTLVEQYGWEYNIDKAKKILDDAGIVDTNGDGVREMPDGTKLGPFTIQVPYGWTDWMMMCDMISANLKEMGIDCTAEFPDFSVWWSRLGEKNWDFVIGWSNAQVGFDHPWNGFRWIMDNRLSHPAGNWENYDNPNVQSLIDAVPKESDPEKLKAIYSQLQEMWLTDLPGVPLFYGATWYEYSEEYWVGWPNEENGFWFANFWTWPNNMPCLFSVVPKGQTPTQPSWVTDTEFSTSKIFEDLAEAPAHGFITVTKTVATTVTSTVMSTVRETVTETTTSEVSVPTMDVTSVAGAGVVALVVGVVVGWLVASRKKT